MYVADKLGSGAPRDLRSPTKLYSFGTPLRPEDGGNVSEWKARTKRSIGKSWPCPPCLDLKNESQDRERRLRPGRKPPTAATTRSGIDAGLEFMGLLCL